MMLVVLDTNVLVSGLLVPGSGPAQIIRQFRDGAWTLAASPAIIEEYGRVLRRRRFGLPPDGVSALLAELEARSLVVIPSRHFNAVPEDPQDNEFLDVAVEAGADVLVSGDRHLLGIEVFRGIPIRSPAAFLARH
ncbi:MAG: putative toxin-antitoxin system toxin component, PIN family [Elusimicrobia bacterium]|nr:putative toxin-antitoxin system toxin component, PIN family [Elusimicrobiota bacterium]